MLQLIKGGVSSKKEAQKKFKHAKMTDTRLMGAIYLYICWEVEGWKDIDELHQFLHIDTEEYGIESYYSIWGSDENEIMSLEAEVAGCLGGKFIELTEAEVIYILKEATAKNKNVDNSYPEGIEEINFILDKEVPRINNSKFLIKQSEKITSVNQLINYFLMRCVGRDFQVAETLCQGPLSVEEFEKIPISVMYRNRINPLNVEKTKFRCETLIECHGRHRVITFYIEVEELKIKSVSIMGDLHITSVEAAFILTSQEFVIVQKLKETGTPIQMDMTISLRRTVTRYLGGTLVMFYADNNKHVHCQTFNMKDDMLGGLLLTEQGELIITAPTQNMADAFQRLAIDAIGEENLGNADKYHLNRSIVLDFAQAEGYFFSEYLEEFEEI